MHGAGQPGWYMLCDTAPINASHVLPNQMQKIDQLSCEILTAENVLCMVQETTFKC